MDLDLRTPQKSNILQLDDRIWAPNPGPQTLAITCPVYELFYGGARGGGKTDFLLGDYAEGVSKYGAAWRGILFRKTYPELEDVIRRSQEIYYRAFPGAHFGKVSKTWTFSTGATLKMRFMDRDDDVMAYQGHTYPWIGIDEIGTWASSYCLDTIKACARSSEGAPVRIRLTGNPGGPGHHWVRKRYIDPMPPLSVFSDPAEEGLQRVFIPSRVGDNPFWQQKDPGYITRLKAIADPALRRAWYLGDWDAFVGQVFEEWRRDLHTCKPFKIPDWWLRFCSGDWGFARPYAIHYYAVDDEGRMWMYRELYGQREGARTNTGTREYAYDVGKRMATIENDTKEEISYRELSPDAWTNKGHTGPTVAEDFDDAGIYWDKADNDRLNGLYQCHLRLRDPGEDRRGNQIRPMFVVFDTCTKFIETVPPLQHDKNDPEDVDKSEEVEDHSYESWRYGCMSRPISSEPPEEEDPEWLKRKKKAVEGSWKTV